MASSSSGARSGERMVHQDFIARIRFSNALPPPPNPPKLLEIPNTGLASGQYTTPGFASRLAREQPLNIEADAELGMPLNLVGMPGVFDGDERSIQAPAQPPALHPHDRPLLRPMAALGKPKVAEANVSFLRRTEYISSITPKRPEGGSARALLAKARKPARAAPDAAADSPQVIKRKIERSFEAAELDLKDPKRVKHPSKKHLKLVAAMPLLPDLDAFPDSGAYVTVKFLTNPVPSSNQYDARLLSGLLRPIDRTASEEAIYEAAVVAHERDPVNNAKPPNLMNYDFYLAQSLEASENFRRKLDGNDPDHDKDELYTHQSADGGHFQFNRVRAYETAQETELDHPTKYDDEVILAFDDDDDDDDDNGSAVYYYPVMQRSAIRPQRTKNIARTIGLPADEGQTVDQLDITVHEPTEEMREAMARYSEKPLGWDLPAEAASPPADDAAALVERDPSPARPGSRSEAGWPSEPSAGLANDDDDDHGDVDDDDDRDAEGEDADGDEN